ncbi:MAG TPA: universal stress protein [Frankiaceae bacterium]|nr:universal stress protein [Frankiaceae bacterium]
MFELGTDGPSLIIAAVDGSETSLRAGAYAAGLARRQGSKLAILFVHTVGGFARSVPGAIPAMAEANRMAAQELRDTIKEQSARLGLDASFYEREGSPFSELVSLADELRADAVIVGASTQAGHRFVGSLALHLVRASRWPVTVVP